MRLWKMNGSARRAFSVLVAIAMLCALVPAAGLAVNDPWTESVIADNEDKTEQFESITSSEEKPGGVRIAAENGHDANVTVSGAIQSEGTAASIEASGEDSDVTFKSGNVTVQTEHENWSGYGVDIWTSNHATVNAETGSVSAPGEAVNVYAEEQSEAHVTVNGDAVSRDDNGVQIWAGENSTADVTVTGNAQGLTGIGAQGVAGSAYVSAGDVTATHNGVFAWAGRDGFTQVVAGNVDAGDVGIQASASGDGETTVIADSVTGETGVYVEASGNGSYVEAYIGGGDGKGSVTANGSYGDGLLVVAENGGEVAVTVNGDVTSADEGLALSVDDTSTADILVTGTLYGKNCGVGGGISEGGKVTLTTWKLDSSSYNNQVKVNPTQEFRAGINYIVKIADSDKDTLTAYNGDDSELAQSHGYGVAHEDQTVRVKVAALDGYEVVSVYNGEGDDKTELTKDADGNYSWKVGKGGGVLFSAVLKAITPEPEPTPSAEPEPTPSTEPEPTPSAEPEPTPSANPEPSPTPKPDDNDDEDDGDDDDSAPRQALQSQELVTIAIVEGDGAAGSLTFSINSGFAIRRADGAVISGSFEMIDDVPALVNDAGEQAVLNEAGELCFDPEAEDGAITLSNVTQRYLRVVFPDGHEEEGSFDLVDDVLVLVNAGATNMPVGEDSRVTFTSMDGPQQSIEATLDPMTIAVLRAALG